MKNADELRELKKQLRREYKARGAALAAEYRQNADERIREAVLRSESWQRAAGVFLYVSMWAEPDTRALLAAALAAGKRVYVPLCCPEHVMKAVQIRSLDELRPGMRGIPEPPADGAAAGPEELDLAVVPCVAATAAGERLGHGAGYYDRFLRLYGCETLCLCYGALLAENLPTDEWDVRMDRVITE